MGRVKAKISDDETAMTDLKPANENPWYVLMTLYGEQTGEEVDWELHEKNRDAWNAWVALCLSKELRNEIIAKSNAQIDEELLEVTSRSEIRQLFRVRCEDEMRPSSKRQKIPTFLDKIDLSGLHFSQALCCEGFVFPEEVTFARSRFEQPTSFEDTFFRGRVDFSGGYFRALALFRNAEFESTADFATCRFAQTASFHSVTFSKETLFEHAVFSETALFRLASFHARLVMRHAQFRGEANFEAAKFKGIASFNYVRFERDAKFNSSLFTYEAYFEGAKFSGPVSFGAVKFLTFAFFDWARFHGDVSFNHSKFFDRAFFKNVEFELEASFCSVEFGGRASFTGTTFGKDAKFSVASFLSTAEFDRVHFDGVTSFESSSFGIGEDPKGTPLFEDSVFEKPVSFRRARFGFTYPYFGGAVLPTRATFTADTSCWPSVSMQDDETSKEACATIRHALAVQGLPDEEHFFFRREMAYAGKQGTWWQRLPYRAYGSVSDFGKSIQRPLLWLLGLWMAPSLVYLACFAWTDVMVGRSWRILEPFGFSFANIFKFLGFQRLYFGSTYMDTLPVWLQAVSGLQTILGFALLFFLGLGLRQRFRLR